MHIIDFLFFKLCLIQRYWRVGFYWHSLCYNYYVSWGIVNQLMEYKWNHKGSICCDVGTEWRYREASLYQYQQLVRYIYCLFSPVPVFLNKISAFILFYVIPNSCDIENLLELGSVINVIKCLSF